METLHTKIKMSIALSPLTAISISPTKQILRPNNAHNNLLYFSTIVNYFCKHRLGTFNMRKKRMNKTRKLDQSFVTLST